MSDTVSTAHGSEATTRSRRPILTSSFPTAALSTHTVHNPHAASSLLLDTLALVAIAALAKLGGWWSYSSLVLAASWIRIKTNSVLHETVLAVSGLGLQLSTTRGLHVVIPSTSISDVVINEGIHGWKVIYYLVVIQKQGHENVRLRVAFPELLPRLDELRRVWQDVRATLYDEER